MSPTRSLDSAVAKGEAALNSLYSLQIIAAKSGNLAVQKALEDDIDTLMDKLTQLRSQAIAADATQAVALDRQLDTITATAKAAEADLAELSNVLNHVVAATKLVDGILTAVG